MAHSCSRYHESFVDINCDLSKNCYGVSMYVILGFLENQMDVPPHPIPIYKETEETETSGDVHTKQKELGVWGHLQEFLPPPLPHPPHVDKRSKLRRHEVIQHGRRPKTGSSLGSLTIHRNTIHGPQAPPQAPQAPPPERPFKAL